MVFQSQPIGAVYASLLAGANMGVLMVIAGEDQADVFINGVKYQSGTKQGLALIGLLTPVPPGDPASPPEVTRCSSLPCRPQTPWCGGWMRTPSRGECILAS